MTFFGVRPVVLKPLIGKLKRYMKDNPMTDRGTPLKMTIPTHDVAGALRQVAERILWDDFQAGKLDPIIAAAAQMLKGMEIGMGYAFALILTGRLNLTLVERERTEP